MQPSHFFAPANPRLYNRMDLLGIYTFYRILLGAVLLLMFQLRVDQQLFGGDAPNLFYWTSLGYTCINIVFLLWMWRTRFQPSTAVLFSSLMVDAAAYMLLIFASGGALSSLSYLLLVAIAAGGIMLSRALANLQAAITCLAIVGETIYRHLEIHSNNQLLLASTLLGSLAFAISLLFQHLSQKVQQSQQEAQTQAAQVTQLQELAHSVIDRMYTGVVVIDAQQRISLINRAGEALLGVSFDPNVPLPIERIAPLKHSYAKWRAQQNLVAGLRQHQFTTDTLTIHFTELNPHTQPDIVIFIEDIRSLQQHAQQLKLASLGRLTASIAHEIRNPLGAISHAAQLLAECDYLAEHDQRLLQIIHTQTIRVNSIVDNVLHLSRRKASQPTRIALYQWLAQFIDDYQTQHNQQHPDNPCAIELIVTHHNTQTLHAYWDESQLRQVLNNLCDNALRHTRRIDGISLRIAIGHEHNRQQPFIRVIDFGDGVAEADRHKLFEPFFTTESTGSGLGLYICRELCEANQAFITYYRTHDGHSCFDIQLSHPQRASFSHSHSIITTPVS